MIISFFKIKKMVMWITVRAKNKLEKADVENGVWGKEKGREERGGGEIFIGIDFQSWVLGEGEG